MWNVKKEHIKRNEQLKEVYFCLLISTTFLIPSTKYLSPHPQGSSPHPQGPAYLLRMTLFQCLEKLEHNPFLFNRAQEWSSANFKIKYKSHPDARIYTYIWDSVQQNHHPGFLILSGTTFSFHISYTCSHVISLSGNRFWCSNYFP